MKTDKQFIDEIYKKYDEYQKEEKIKRQKVMKRIINIAAVFVVALSSVVVFSQKKTPKVLQEMKKEDAVKSGAECMFIEKYPEIVTVYSIGDVSKELCGGPHVSNTSELGHFKIKKEESSSSGIRRIKAILD